MLPCSDWFDEIRNGNYSILSNLISYGDPLYVFFELISNRIIHGDRYFTGVLTMVDLRETVIWKTIEMFRILSIDAVIYSTENKIHKALCNVFHILRLFGITLEDKADFRRVMGDNTNNIYYSYIDGGNIVPYTIDEHHVYELHAEYERFRVGGDEISKQMRILYNILGNIVFKCIAERDAIHRTDCIHFSNVNFLQLNNVDSIPVLRIYRQF